MDSPEGGRSPEQNNLNEATKAANRWLNTETGAVQRRITQTALKHPNWSAYLEGGGIGWIIKGALTGDIASVVIGAGTAAAGFVLERSKTQYDQRVDINLEAIKQQRQSRK
ncbi:hypothetical protein HYS95_03150 [Candidatus Daviesbacteria bacterium]|nr:hypothetical protein [Candidatus Daviesbacteria bacterium]